MATVYAQPGGMKDPKDPFGLATIATNGGASGPTSGSGGGVLSRLIASLSGAVGNINPNQQARQETIQTQQQTQSDYSKPNAFADASALITQTLQQQMAESMPSIIRAADGAGTSAGSMRALLTQQAVENAAQAAAAQGARMAVDYGNISNSSGSVLEALTRSDPTEIQALLGALRLRNDINQQGSSSSTRYAPPPSSRPTITSRNPVSIGSGPNNSAGMGNGMASAVFLPSTPAPSTSSFFNRPGGILAGAAGATGGGVGPAKTDSQILSTLQQGLLPSQQWEGTPVPSDFFNNSIKF